MYLLLFNFYKFYVVYAMSPVRLLKYSDKAAFLSLRHLELVAYASVISAFRAEGDLNEEKLQVLLQLCSILGIHTQRHRAEVFAC